MSRVFFAAAGVKRRLEKLAWDQLAQRRMSSYLKSDRRPWRTGYSEYRDQYLRRMISDPDVVKIFENGGELPKGYAFRLDARMIEIPWVLSRFAKKEGPLLDAGSALNSEFVLSSPALANKRVIILTLAPEGDAFWRLGVSYVFGDLRQ